MEYSVFRNTMADMTYPQVEAVISKGACALLPVSVVEEHGPHLCLGTDIYLTQTVVEKIQKWLQREQYEVLIAPPFYWGVNSITNGFTGSFEIKPETMSLVLLEIIQNLKRWGFKEILLLNFHGDFVHIKTMIQVVEKAVQEGIAAYFVNSKNVFTQLGNLEDRDYLVIVDLDQRDIALEEKYLDIHAGAFETSWMLHSFRELVDVEIAKKLEPTKLDVNELIAWTHGESTAKSLTPKGYFGNPANMDVNKMEKIEAVIIDGYSRAIMGVLKNRRH